MMKICTKKSRKISKRCFKRDFVQHHSANDVLLPEETQINDLPVLKKLVNEQRDVVLAHWNVSACMPQSSDSALDHSTICKTLLQHLGNRRLLMNRSAAIASYIKLYAKDKVLSIHEAAKNHDAIPDIKIFPIQHVIKTGENVVHTPVVLVITSSLDYKLMIYNLQTETGTFDSLKPLEEMIDKLVDPFYCKCSGIDVDVAPTSVQFSSDFVVHYSSLERKFRSKKCAGLVDISHGGDACCRNCRNNVEEVTVNENYHNFNNFKNNAEEILEGIFGLDDFALGTNADRVQIHPEFPVSRAPAHDMPFEVPFDAYCFFDNNIS